METIFQRFLSVFLPGALCIGLSFPLSVQASKGLEIAIFPYLPTPTLLERYQPLRIYLQQQLGESVTLVSAPDYPSFFERTQRREYQIVITAAHAARWAEVEAGYRPLLRPGFDTNAILLVRKDSWYRDIKDLRGKTIATPGPFAIVSQLGAEWLRKAGLNPGQEVTLQSNFTHATAMHAVAEGVTDAALISNRAFVAAKSELKDRVHSLGQSKDGGPGVVYLAHPAMSEQRVAAFKAAVLTFVKTPEGKAFVASLGYDTLREIKPGELAMLDPYVRELKLLMSANQSTKP